MPKSKTVHPIFEYFVYNTAENTSKCKSDGCPQIIKGKHATNLTNHIQRKHSNLKNQLREKLEKYHSSTQPETRKRQDSIINVKISRENFLMGCLETVVIDGRPFNLMEGKGLRRMIGPVIAEFNRGQTPVSVGREYIQRKAIEAQNIIKNKIKTELSGRLVSLQMDLTTHLGRVIFGMNTQYFADDKVVVRTLAMKHLMDDMCGVTLAREIDIVLREFGLDVDDIYTVTTDNGSNVIKCTKILKIMQERRLEEFLSKQSANEVNVDEMMRLINIEADRIRQGLTLHFVHQIRCAAHVLNLVLTDVLGTDDMILRNEKYRNLVKNLKRTSIDNLLASRGRNRPSLDTVIRWSSTFEMVSELVIFFPFHMIYKKSTYLFFL